MDAAFSQVMVDHTIALIITHSIEVELKSIK